MRCSGQMADLAIVVRKQRLFHHALRRFLGSTSWFELPRCLIKLSRSVAAVVVVTDTAGLTVTQHRRQRGFGGR